MAPGERMNDAPRVTLYLLAFFRVVDLPGGVELDLKDLRVCSETYDTLTRDVSGNEAVLEVLQATARDTTGAVAILRDAVENTDLYAWCREPMEGRWP